MQRTTQTALVTVLGAFIAVPAAAQTGNTDLKCPEAAFETDIDRDNVVSTEEASAAARREFARFDVNKDEKITREEFIGCFAVPTMDIKGDQAARTEEGFARADLDKDGEIDRAEFGLGAQQAFDEALDLATAGTAAGQETEQVATGQEEVVTEQDVPGANMAEEPLTDEAEALRAETDAEPADEAKAATEPAEQAFDQPVDLADEGAAAGEETEQVATGEERVVTEQDVPGANMAEEPLTDEAEAARAQTGATLAEEAEMGQDVGEPGWRAPQIVQERFLDSPYADWRTMEDRRLTADEIAFNSAELFAALDANRNRALDPSEWMRIAPIAERGPAELGRVFENIDLNDDATVTLSEYVNSVLAAHAAAAKAAAEGLGKTAAGDRPAGEQASQTRTDEPAMKDDQATATGAAAQAELADRAAGTQQGPDVAVEVPTEAGQAEKEGQAAATGAMAQAELADRAAGTRQGPSVAVEAPTEPGQPDEQVSMGEEAQAAPQGGGVPIFLYRIYRF